jgi:hypothetical protein
LYKVSHAFNHTVGFHLALVWVVEEWELVTELHDTFLHTMVQFSGTAVGEYTEVEHTQFAVSTDWSAVRHDDLFSFLHCSEIVAVRFAALVGFA